MAEIKTLSISSKMGGVISDAPFENARVEFLETIGIELGPDDDERSVREQYREVLHDDLVRKFDLVKNKFKAEAVEREFRKIRFYERDGKKWPSVTSITGWSKDFHMSDSELAQYAARGTLIHKLIELYIESGSWLDIEALVALEPKLRDDAATLFRGSKGLKIEDCSHEKFFEKYGKDFTFADTEKVVWNEDDFYMGRLDYLGTYKGVDSLIDVKTGQGEFKQLAAYAKCDGIKVDQLVIIPAGPTDNKSGVMAPRVEKDINKHYAEFLRDRDSFRERFGI